MLNEEKIAHLGFIQGVINRMGSNSFLIKGWSITLMAATFALSAKDANQKFAYIVLLPLILFWGLDAFFLRQEKLYRKLYEKVAGTAGSDIDFHMNAYRYNEEVVCFFKVLFSKTLIVVYGASIIFAVFFMWTVLGIMHIPEIPCL